MATKKNAAAVQAATEYEAMTTAEVSTQADEQADEVAEPILLDTTFKDTMNQTNALLAAIAGQNYPITSWKAVQNIGRAVYLRLLAGVGRTGYHGGVCPLSKRGEAGYRHQAQDVG